jgi:hypothetical protein
MTKGSAADKGRAEDKTMLQPAGVAAGNLAEIVDGRPAHQAPDRLPGPIGRRHGGDDADKGARDHGDPAQNQPSDCLAPLLHDCPLGGNPCPRPRPGSRRDGNAPAPAHLIARPGGAWKRRIEDAYIKRRNSPPRKRLMT